MRLAHGDIENAIRLLNRAKVEKDDTIKGVIVKYCIIEYARPFTTSNGVFRKKFKPLDNSSVFPVGNSDHEALMTERNQRIAHSDISAYNPKLHYWPEPNIFPIVQRPSHLYNDIDKLIEKMLVLCDIVIKYLADQMTTLETFFRKDIEKDHA
jgi:hypothetical protein